VLAQVQLALPLHAVHRADGRTAPVTGLVRFGLLRSRLIRPGLRHRAAGSGGRLTPLIRRRHAAGLVRNCANMRHFGPVDTGLRLARCEGALVVCGTMPHGCGSCGVRGLAAGTRRVRRPGAAAGRHDVNLCRLGPVRLHIAPDRACRNQGQLGTAEAQAAAGTPGGAPGATTAAEPIARNLSETPSCPAVHDREQFASHSAQNCSRSCSVPDMSRS
jgi:hypothetical protein